MQGFRQLRAAALALFLGVLALGPSLLPGRSLLPQDPRAFEPALAELAPDEAAKVQREVVPHRRDRLFQFLPFDRAVGEAWAEGRVPLWEPRILCGLPLLAQGTSRAFYPTAVLFALFEPAACYAWIYLAHLVLAGLFAYRLAKRLGASEEGALLSDASLVFGGWALAHLHHPMIFFAALWALPAFEFAFAIREGEARRLRHTLGLASCVALSWFAGFPQATLLLVYALGIFALWCLAPSRGALPVLAGTALGTCIAAVQILPMLEAAAASARASPGYEGFAIQALTPTHLLDLVLPGQLAAAGEILPMDAWHPRPSFFSLLLVPASRHAALAAGRLNHSETALGFGIWPLLFALTTLGLLRRRGALRARVTALWAVTGLGFLGACATPGLTHLLLLLPGMDAGDPKRLIALPALALPLLAGLGWRRPGIRALALALVPGTLGVLIGLFVLGASEERFTEAATALIGGWHGVEAKDVLVNFLPGEALLNQELLGRGLLALGAALCLPFLLVRLAGLGLTAFLFATALELLPLVAALSPAPALEGVSARAPLLEGASHRSSGGPAPARLLRLEPTRDERGVGDVRLLPPNLPLLHGLADATGYAPLVSARSEAFFEALERGSTSGGAGLGCLRSEASLTSPLASALAADYLLTTSAAELRGWSEVERRGSTRLLAQDAHRVRLFFDVEGLGLEGEVPTELGPPDPKASVVVERFGAGRIDLRTKSAAPCLVFVSEAWAKGWNARVDRGPASATLPAAGMFQAVACPAGEHVIELAYEPASFLSGALISAATLTGIALASFLVLLSARRRGKNTASC